MILSQRSIFTLLGYAVLRGAPSSAFAPAVETVTTRKVSFSFRLPASLDDELMDLEKFREQFEHLMETENKNSEYEQSSKEQQKIMATSARAHSKEAYIPRPLTESSRRRRKLEMELLESLEDSDEAIDELVSLWMIERGKDAAKQLQDMEAICSPGLVEEEAILRHLIEEYPHWAEPFCRLGALLHFKGRTEESEDLCQVSLAMKPWHFEALHSLVLNALRKEDIATAIRWQRLALPNLNPSTDNKARKAWVERALKDAQDSLEKAEVAAVEKKKNDEISDNHRGQEVWQ